MSIFPTGASAEGDSVVINYDGLIRRNLDIDSQLHADVGQALLQIPLTKVACKALDRYKDPRLWFDIDLAAITDNAGPMFTKPLELVSIRGFTIGKPEHADYVHELNIGTHGVQRMVLDLQVCGLLKDIAPIKLTGSLDELEVNLSLRDESQTKTSDPLTYRPIVTRLDLTRPATKVTVKISDKLVF